MNDDLSPLEPNELDELLSADLDGELAAAATDRGSDVETLRARIAVTPGAPARRAELAAARDALAVAPEMDELVAARLRAKAVNLAVERQALRDDARRRRRGRILMATSGVAAAIVLVVAVVAAGRAGNGGSSRASSESAATPATDVNGDAASTSSPPVATGANGTALGSYRNAQVLGAVAVRVANAAAARQGLEKNAARYGNADSSQPLSAATSPTTTANTKAALPAAGSTTSFDRLPPTGDALAGSGADANRCAAPASPTPGDALVLRASATLAARPVLVFVFAGHGDHTVVILTPSCMLVNVQNLS